MAFVKVSTDFVKLYIKDNLDVVWQNLIYYIPLLCTLEILAKKLFFSYLKQI